MNGVIYQYRYSDLLLILKLFSQRRKRAYLILFRKFFFRKEAPFQQLDSGTKIFHHQSRPHWIWPFFSVRCGGKAGTHHRPKIKVGVIEGKCQAKKNETQRCKKILVKIHIIASCQKILDISSFILYQIFCDARYKSGICEYRLITYIGLLPIKARIFQYKN